MTAPRGFAVPVRVGFVAAILTFVLSSGCDDGTSPLRVPTLTSVSPPSAVRGTSVTAVLTGTDFVPGLTQVHFTSFGVTVNLVQVVSETSLNVVLIIGGEAELGERQVTVSTPGGSSEPQAFTIEAAAPTLSSINPSSGVRGTTVPVALSGTQFLTGATQVAVSGSGVTVSNVQVTSESTMTATLTIAGDAEVGDRSVTATTEGGTSGGRTFTVRPQPPTLTSLSATAGSAGTSVSQTLTGSNFVPGATVSVSGAGVTVSNVQVVNPTTITASFQIAAGAPVGSRNVTVTTTGGTSNAVAFAVGPALPTLATVSVTEAMAGAIVSQTLTGTNFLAGATVTVEGAGVTVSEVQVVNATQITATFTVGTAAAPGARNVRVVTAGGTSNPRTFTITTQAPTLTALLPAQIARGAATPVTLTGTGFVTDATTVVVSGDGVTVGAVNVTSGTTATVSLTVAANAALGARNLTVQTVGGTTAAQTLTVVAPPTILSFTATPSSVTAGQSVQLAWVTDSASTCSIDNGVGTVSCNGSVMVTPGASTTYNLSAAAGGSTTVRSVSVTVTGP